MADNTNLDLADTFSLEAWIKRASIGANHGIVSKGNGAYYMRIDSTNSLMLLRSQIANVATSTPTITDTTTWHHVAAAKSGTTRALYIDGAAVAFTGVDSTMVVTPSPCRSGPMTAVPPVSSTAVSMRSRYTTSLSRQRS